MVILGYFRVCCLGSNASPHHEVKTCFRRQNLTKTNGTPPSHLNAEAIKSLLSNDHF